MSLNNAKLKSDLKNLYTASQAGNGSADDNLDSFLNAMVEALEAYIKSATVVYSTGLVAGPYPVTGTFNSTIE